MNDLWFVGINGTQQGPLGTQQVIDQIRAGGIAQTAYVYGQHLTAWTPISQVPTFAGVFAPIASAPPAPPPAAPAPITADVIDFTVGGQEMQFVEIVLDPHEAAIARSGSIFFMDANIRMEAVGHMNAYVNHGTARERVAFAASRPGKVIPIDLRQYGNTLFVRRETFLCAAKGIAVNAGNANLQKLEGQGLVFLIAGGTAVIRDLAATEIMRIDQNCLVALDARVKYDGQPVATLTGPGKVWLQSLRHPCPDKT